MLEGLPIKTNSSIVCEITNFSNCPAHKKAGKCKKTVGVDLDGTLFYNKFPEIGLPLPDVIEYMQLLKKQNFYIIIHTARLSGGYESSWSQQLRLIQFVLAMYGISYNEIWQGKGKPVCCFYIDDNSFKSLEEFVNTKIKIEEEEK